MTGVDQSLKGTEPEISIVTSSNPGSPSVFISDEFMPNPEDGRIPSTAFEPSFPTNDWSMVTATPRCETTSDMFSQNFDGIYSNSLKNLMMSPSIQPMDGSAGYDPDRIPSAIFSSKPAGQCDWSTASNESLFSIPNYSFPRNQANLRQKSQELGLIGEFNTTSNSFSPNLHSVIETDTEHEREHSLDINPSKNVEGLTSKQTEHSQKHVQSGVERNSNCSSTTVTSAESQKSSNSFAFPVLLNDVEKSSSLAKPQSQTVEANSGNTEKRWFGFSCLRIWDRRWACCP